MRSILHRVSSWDRRLGAAALGLCLAAAGGALGACSANKGGSSFQTGGAGGTGGEGGAGGQGGVTSGGQGGQGAGDLGFDGGGVNDGGGTCDPKGPDDDVDGDGYTETEGDCNDCDKNVNPNAVEVATEQGKDPHDEDCDGLIDEPPDPACDDGLAIDSVEPLDGARAVDLCKVSQGAGDWGVVSAQWVLADGSPPPASHPEVDNFHLGHGMLTHFGANIQVRNGKRMLGLSSGTARNPDDPGYQSVGGFSKGYQGSHPQGFPKESPACPGSITGTPNDPTGLEVKIRVPSNAYGFSFDFDFFTYEWPSYICSQYNDFFVALLSPIPQGQQDGNVSFDSQGNPVSVNNAFIEVCGCAGNPPSPCVAGGKSFPCALGNIELVGTGFGFDSGFGQDHGSTSWLKTQAPVTPGSEITIRWAVYDSGDGALDTSTLVDNWQWIAKPGITVGTDPVPK
jgi:hypothetical protein